jgi:hypothetical protein
MEFNFQDYIILVVRKAMFKREDAIRIAATNAIVELIVTESEYRNNEANPLQDSSSQPSSSQLPEIHQEVGGVLFQELSGLLRRCLSQQVSLALQIKEYFYLSSLVVQILFLISLFCYYRLESKWSCTRVSFE